MVELNAVRGLECDTALAWKCASIDLVLMKMWERKKTLAPCFPLVLAKATAAVSGAGGAVSLLSLSFVWLCLTLASSWRCDVL